MAAFNLKGRHEQLAIAGLLLRVEDTEHFTKERRSTNLLSSLFSSFFCPFVFSCVFYTKEEPIAVQNAVQNVYDFVISRCCLAENGKEMYKDL